MALTPFRVLDNAIEAGGTNLPAKKLAVSGKDGAKVLADLCAAGCLEKSGGKAARYTVTPEGRAAWEKEAPAKRRQEVLDREREAQRKDIGEFLALVQAKQGKALTKPEAGRVPPSVLQDALARKLVEPGSKDRCYRLLPAGEEFLLAEQPLQHQLEQLRELQRKASTRWRAARQRIATELEGLRDLGPQAVEEAAAQLAARVEEGLRGFDQTLGELSAFSGLLVAAGQIREIVEAAGRQSLQRLGAEKNRLAEIEARLAEAVEQQRRELEEIERRVEDRLNDLARRSGHGREASSPAANTEGPATPPDSAVWERARQAYDALHKDVSRVGGAVKIPDLTDRVRRAYPSLPVAAFHALLQKWQREDRLTLQVCNDPGAEPRGAEGIPSPRGTLFYVNMR